MYIGKSIFLIDGFTRRTGDPTGIEKLWHRLFVLRDHFGGSRTLLMPREWNSPIDPMMQMINRHCSADARIAIGAFSYGAGYAAIRLARELRRWGRDVELMLLIDPVHRTRFISTRWLALTGRIPIRIPQNVRNVVSWRQNSGGCFDPKGSPLRVCQAKTRIIHETVCPGLTHHTIQYHHTIQEECFERLRALMLPPSPPVGASACRLN